MRSTLLSKNRNLANRLSWIKQARKSRVSQISKLLHAHDDISYRLWATDAAYKNGWLFMWLERDKRFFRLYFRE